MNGYAGFRTQIQLGQVSFEIGDTEISSDTATDSVIGMM